MYYDHELNDSRVKRNGNCGIKGVNRSENDFTVTHIINKDHS